MLVHGILVGAAIVLAAWAALGAWASWQVTRRRRSPVQWVHLVMLGIFVVAGLYLLVSLGSVIIAAHS
ncbi:MAG: hypothetical protein H0X24_01685 [Ktedonobacterales bacterium]|nr:hypothetical protein [Ktedonobacterales bacterium]